MRARRAFWSAATLLAVGAACPDAFAQDSGGGAPPGSVVVPSGGGGQVVVTPGTTTTTTTTAMPPGYPQPGAPDINEGLDQSSRPTNDASHSTDGFDFGRGPGGENVRGGKNSSATLGTGGAMRVPSFHTVRKGDTLWGLSGYYYGNPWNWPRVWSYNPQISNPHWIYPGDQVRMKLGGDLRDSSTLTGGSGGMADRRSTVPPDTVFLRTNGFIDDPKRDVWGELVGAREDTMLLAEGNHVYLQMKPGKDVRIGQQLTIFRPIRKPAAVKGSRRPPGQIIGIKGTVRVDQYDPKTHLARGEIVESVDAIERGAMVGDVGRRLDVVPVKPAKADIWARVLTSTYPHEFFGQNQIVFIDRGTEDGLSAGNRLYVVAKGDVWRSSLKTAARTARDRLRQDVPDTAYVEGTPFAGDEKHFPEEIIGELRVLRANKYSSVTLVTVSHREIQPGDRAVSRKGY